LEIAVDGIDCDTVALHGCCLGISGCLTTVIISVDGSDCSNCVGCTGTVW
jgi:hypothetical protein